MLVANGADVNQKNDLNQTPLSIAKNDKYYDIMQLLVLNGAVEKVEPSNAKNL